MLLPAPVLYIAGPYDLHVEVLGAYSGPAIATTPKSMYIGKPLPLPYIWGLMIFM